MAAGTVVENRAVLDVLDVTAKHHQLFLLAEAQDAALCDTARLPWVSACIPALLS